MERRGWRANFDLARQPFPGELFCVVKTSNGGVFGTLVFVNNSCVILHVGLPA